MRKQLALWFVMAAAAAGVPKPAHAAGPRYADQTYTCFAMAYSPLQPFTQVKPAMRVYKTEFRLPGGDQRELLQDGGAAESLIKKAILEGSERGKKTGVFSRCRGQQTADFKTWRTIDSDMARFLEPVGPTHSDYVPFSFDTKVLPYLAPSYKPRRKTNEFKWCRNSIFRMPSDGVFRISKIIRVPEPEIPPGGTAQGAFKATESALEQAFSKNEGISTSDCFYADTYEDAVFLRDLEARLMMLNGYRSVVLDLDFINLSLPTLAAAPSKGTPWITIEAKKVNPAFAAQENAYKAKLVQQKATRERLDGEAAAEQAKKLAAARARTAKAKAEYAACKAKSKDGICRSTTRQ